MESDRWDVANQPIHFVQVTLEEACAFTSQKEAVLKKMQPPAGP